MKSYPFWLFLVCRFEDTTARFKETIFLFQQNGASLVSVNNAQEHDFIVQQLKINDAVG